MSIHDEDRVHKTDPLHLGLNRAHQSLHQTIVGWSMGSNGADEVGYVFDGKGFCVLGSCVRRVVRHVMNA